MHSDIACEEASDGDTRSKGTAWHEPEELPPLRAETRRLLPPSYPLLALTFLHLQHGEQIILFAGYSAEPSTLGFR